MREVPHILENYENPWEIFNNFLTENNIDKNEASGVRFYYYLIMCVMVRNRIVLLNDL